MDKIYAGMQKDNSTADATWMNCGYIPSEWTDEQVYEVVDDMIKAGTGSKQYRGTCAALATKMYQSTLHAVAEDAEEGRADPKSVSVLDCGCGYGAQSVLFKTELCPDAKYTGINISSAQIEGAKTNTQGLSDVTLKVADATDLTVFEDSSFTHVYALECAFHFDTRFKFLQEAARVLKPGGSYAAMDCIPKLSNDAQKSRDKQTDPGAARMLRRRLSVGIGAIYQEVGFFWTNFMFWNFVICGCLYGMHSWPMNKENSIEEYEKSLREAGFTGHIQVNDISDNVFLYNKKYRHRVLGIDKNWFSRWFSPLGWYMSIKFLTTEWSANPFMLAILCRQQFSPYVLVTAKK